MSDRPRRAVAAFFAVVLADAAAAEEWSGGITFYGWVPTFTGDQSADNDDGRRLSVDFEAESILEALDFGGMGFAEARRGRLGLFVDLVYADLESGGDASAGFGFGGLDADAGIEALLLTGGVSWRLLEGERGGLDGFGALRYASVEASFTVDEDAALIGGRDASGDADWVDPLIGLRGRYRLTDSLTIGATGDVGGFGVGSEFTWEAFGALDWAFAPNWSAVLGYRVTAIDYEDGDLDLDLTAYGPLVGIGWRF